MKSLIIPGFFCQAKKWPFSIPNLDRATTAEAKLLEKIANGNADFNSTNEATKRAPKINNVTDYNPDDKTPKTVVSVHKIGDENYVAGEATKYYEC